MKISNFIIFFAMINTCTYKEQGKKKLQEYKEYIKSTLKSTKNDFHKHYNTLHKSIKNHGSKCVQQVKEHGPTFINSVIRKITNNTVYLWNKIMNMCSKTERKVFDEKKSEDFIDQAGEQEEDEHDDGEFNSKMFEELLEKLRQLQSEQMGSGKDGEEEDGQDVDSGYVGDEAIEESEQKEYL